MLSQACLKMPEITSSHYLCNLKENVKVEVDFLPPNRRERFLQIDTIIFKCKF